MGAPLEISDVRFRYRNGFGLDGVSLEVREGEVVGLVGQEGAGKSTLIRVALGLMRASSGGVRLFSREVPKDLPNALAGVGAALDPPGFHPGWTGRRHLRHAADLAGARDEARINWAISRLGIGSLADSAVERYDRPRRAKLALARAMAGAPRLLLLDETCSALAGEDRGRALGMIRQLAARAGVGVLYATDRLPDALEVASRLVVLDSGRVVHEGPTGQVQAAGLEMTVIVENAERAAEELVRVRGMGAELVSAERLRLAGYVDVPELVSWLCGRGFRIGGVERQAQTLEDLLVRLSRGPLPPAPENALGGDAGLLDEPLSGLEDVFGTTSGGGD